jgi:hypothetical protein
MMRWNFAVMIFSGNSVLLAHQLDETAVAGALWLDHVKLRRDKAL